MSLAEGSSPRAGALVVLAISLLASGLAPWAASVGQARERLRPRAPGQQPTPPPTAALWGVELLSVHPHDPQAHTQGLVFGGGGLLFESEGKAYPDGAGGEVKRSSLRKVELTTGRILDKVDRSDVWAEGLALVGDELIQITLSEGLAIAYDRDSLAEKRRMVFSGAGWGLCFDGTQLWMSDGSARLSRRDPGTFAELGTLEVVSGTAPLANLNALHCAAGTILANLFPGTPDLPRDRIAVIDAGSGRVRAVIDARGLLAPAEQVGVADLNGIAQLSDGSFVLTGKLWPKLFRVQLRAGPTLIATPSLTPSASPTASVTPTRGPPAQHFGLEILNIYPRDTGCFTQGLVLDHGRLFDSCGIYGEGRVREIEPETGRTLRVRSLDDPDFGEGLALYGDRLYQLTWREHRVYVHDRDTFAPITQFSIATEGWGLCYDGGDMVVSDGTDNLYFYEPATFRLRRSVSVRLDGFPVTYLNELECVGGEVWANLLYEKRIVRIDPDSGRVTGVLHAGQLAPAVVPLPTYNAVLNGIAHDARDDTYLLTGKRWDRLFRVRLKSLAPLYLPMVAQPH